MKRNEKEYLINNEETSSITRHRKSVSGKKTTRTGKGKRRMRGGKRKSGKEKIFLWKSCK